MVEDPSLRRPGELSGDVDGDGAAEEVAIAAAGERVPGCSFFLVVGERSAAIDQEGMSTELGLPSIEALREVDGRPGAEVVVGLVSGASTQYFGLYSMGGGSLERLGVVGPTTPKGLFPSGGGVTHLAASDCRAPGEVLISSAIYRGRRYEVRREVYRLEEGAFRFDPLAGEVLHVGQRHILTVPEFAAPPFGSCPPA